MWIAGIGSLTGVKMAVCGIKCIDLTTEAIKILVVHISDNRENIREKISLICKTFQIYGDINMLT